MFQGGIRFPAILHIHQDNACSDCGAKSRMHCIVSVHWPQLTRTILELK